jgi:dTDP-4-dehydrorhamnose 3,5-epimerase
VGYELSAENHRMLWIPPGFAHGFLVLSETADFLYKCTSLYDPPSDRGIRWDDPAIGIAWPDVGAPPLLSAKDAEARLLADAELFP